MTKPGTKIAPLRWTAPSTDVHLRPEEVVPYSTMERGYVKGDGLWFPKGVQ